MICELASSSFPLVEPPGQTVLWDTSITPASIEVIGG